MQAHDFKQACILNNFVYSVVRNCIYHPITIPLISVFDRLIKMKKTNRVYFFSVVNLLALLLLTSVAIADEPGREEFQERIPLPPTDEVPVPAAAEDDWIFGVHGGVTVFTLADEHTQVGPALFVDARSTAVPLNLRVGVEGTHVNLEQDRVVNLPGIGANPDVDYVRVPFAIEYYTDLCPKSTLFIGGGPDIISINGVSSDGDVGAHLGARVLQKITDTFGVSLEAGYQWADLDIYGDPVDLDGAYITTLLSVTL